MDRTFYYVGIAFFGMINGLFNPIWVLFSVIHVQILGAGALVRQRPPDADVRIPDGVHRHHHRGRHPGCNNEHDRPDQVGASPLQGKSGFHIPVDKVVAIFFVAERMNAAQPEHVEAVLAVLC